MMLIVVGSIIVVATSIGMGYCLVRCPKAETIREEERILKALAALTGDDPTKRGAAAR